MKEVEIVEILFFRSSICLKQLASSAIILFLFPCCIVVPKLEEKKDSRCKLVTRSWTLETQGEIPESCDRDCLAFAAGLYSSSVVLSGSIYVLGNTIHWFEKVGRCEDITVQKQFNQLLDKAVAAGGMLMKTKEDLVNWFKKE